VHLKHSLADKIFVACASDDNYCMPLAVMLFSLVSNLAKGTEIHIFVISLGISQDSQQRLRKTISCPEVSVTLDFVQANEDWVDCLPARGQITLAAYLRLFIPLVVPDSCETILYLDSDILVRKDITPLWQFEIGDNYFLAARDTAIPTVSSKYGLYNWKELGIPDDAPYFNSGVLFINVKKWRLHNLTSTLIDYARTHNHRMRTHDQEALNANCQGSWGELDMTWNVLPLPMSHYAKWQRSVLRDYVESNYDELSKNPAIVHFATMWKPWVAGYRVPFQQEWFKSLVASGWYSPVEYWIWYVKWVIQHYTNAAVRIVSRSLGTIRQSLDKKMLLRRADSTASVPGPADS